MFSRGEYWCVMQREDKLHWIHYDATKRQLLARGDADSWQSLPAPDAARIVFVPTGHRIRVVEIDLPKRNRRRFMHSLSFALEERLLRDAECYHFVTIASTRRTSTANVGVLECDGLESWIDDAARGGFVLSMVVPDYLCIPAPDPDSWTIDVGEEPFLLRQASSGATLSGSLEDTPPAGLMLALEHARERPLNLRIRVRNKAQKQLVEQWRSRFEALELSMTIAQESAGRALWLAAQLAVTRAPNFLSGPYANKRAQLPWRSWLPAAAMAATLIFTLTTGLLLDTHRLTKEHALVSNAIEQTYRSAYPQVKNLVDPRFQMEQALRRLRATEETQPKNSLVEWLMLLAPSFDGAYLVSALEFDQDSIRIEVVVTDVEALNALRQRLSQFAEVKIVGREQGNDGLIGRIRIRKSV